MSCTSLSAYLLIGLCSVSMVLGLFIIIDSLELHIISVFSFWHVQVDVGLWY